MPRETKVEVINLLVIWLKPTKNYIISNTLIEGLNVFIPDLIQNEEEIVMLIYKPNSEIEEKTPCLIHGEVLF